MHYSVIKLQSPFERIKIFAPTPEIGLYKAIITQAIIDSTSFSNDMEFRKSKVEALWWIFGESEEFIEVCDGALMEPCFVRKITIEAMQFRTSKKA